MRHSYLEAELAKLGEPTSDSIAKLARRLWTGGRTLVEVAGGTYLAAVRAGFQGHQGEWFRLVEGTSPKRQALPRSARAAESPPAPDPFADLTDWLSGD